MRFRGLHIVALLLVLLSSCGPRKIPRGDMEAIMRDILLQDQLIKDDKDLKPQADTSLVYEGIFRSYGYDTDDFIRSLAYYLEDPSKMEKIMGNVASGLEKQAKALGKELDLRRWKENLMRIYAMVPDTSLPHVPPRPVDTLKIRFSDDSVWMDVPVDSLRLIPRDSLLFLRDSL